MSCVVGENMRTFFDRKFCFGICLSIVFLVVGCQSQHIPPCQQKHMVCESFPKNSFPLEQVRHDLRIQHCRYGRGSVVALNNGAVEIEFESGKRSWFLWQAAPLLVLP